MSQLVPYLNFGLDLSQADFEDCDMYTNYDPIAQKNKMVSLSIEYNIALIHHHVARLFRNYVTWITFSTKFANNYEKY